MINDLLPKIFFIESGFARLWLQLSYDNVNTSYSTQDFRFGW